METGRQIVSSKFDGTGPEQQGQLLSFQKFHLLALLLDFVMRLDDKLGKLDTKILRNALGIRMIAQQKRRCRKKAVRFYDGTKDRTGNADVY